MLDCWAGPVARLECRDALCRSQKRRICRGFRSTSTALFERLRDEVRRSGSGPGAGPRAGSDEERRAARAEAERLWPVSADRSLRLRPGVRGGLGTPVKAVLRKLMRWYVEPLAYDQRSFNAASLRLIDDLQQQVDRLEAELEALARSGAADEDRRRPAPGAVRAGRGRDLHRPARRRAARARSRGRARHGAVQVVSGNARADPGVPVAAARPGRGGRRRIDLVVATKFPSYLVRHPDKRVWLVHQFRQAYELDGTELGQFGESPEDRALRRKVQELDRLALGEATRLFSTSRNVADRLERSTGLARRCSRTRRRSSPTAATGTATSCSR